MVSMAERGLESVLLDSPDLLRHTFRRGELYNSASSSTRGVQCQLLVAAAAAAATAATAATAGSASRHAPTSTSNEHLHWTYGPDIYRRLRDVRIYQFYSASVEQKRR